MPDQADHLRTLVQATAAGGIPTNAPPIVAVASGRPGAGVTTTTVRAAIALCRMDFRVVLVDADLDQPAIANLCQVTGDTTLADVFSGRRTVQEALVQGPVGIQILPGINKLRDFDQSMASQDRLVAGLKRLGTTTDIILLDLGAGMNPGIARIWRQSDLILLMTTTEPDAVMDAYAAIKLLDQRGRDTTISGPGPNEGQKRDSNGHEGPSWNQFPPIACVIRGAGNPSMATDVHHRLATACQRFLGIELLLAPPIHGLEQTGSALHTPIALASEPPCLAESYNTLAHYIASAAGSIDRTQQRMAA